MQKFDSLIFWCEFPKEINWKEFNETINFKSEVYIASNSKKEFLLWKSKIKSKQITKVGVWPILTKEEGYWFSGYSSRKSIEKLKEFIGIDMKIDLEPPLLNMDYGFFNIICRYTKFFLLNRTNNKGYLNKIILKLSKKSEIILSGFPFPKFLTSFYIKELESRKNLVKNYFIYSTLIPKMFRSLTRYYNKMFIKNAIKKNKHKVFFAVGCVGHGILGNEPTYRNTYEMEKDLNFLLNNGIRNVVIFDLAGIMKRRNPEEWFNTIRKYTNFY